MAWERKRNTETDANGSRTLEHLMTFLRLEVQGEEMVQLAKSGFGTPIRKRDSPTERVKLTELMTASALASSKKSSDQERKVLIDTACENSYISESVTSILKATPLRDAGEIEIFIEKTKLIMSDGCFNLRIFGSNVASESVDKHSGETFILGIIWDLDNDVLKCCTNFDSLTCEVKITKRLVLSTVQKVFDPIGMLAPSTLLPKLLLQEIWKMEKAWDQELPQNIVNKFMKWLNDIQILKDVTVPRLKSLSSGSSPLPPDRVTDCAIFEVVVIDLAGPLFLKTDQKVWITLFTCTVYRALHLELVNALSSDGFLLALRRFIARRGRPRIIYCDNGTNFRGAFNDLAKLDWHKISRETSTQKIVWKFMPPTAVWWGGWWERLVRIIKELLRRSLGKSILSYEELSTVICDCEFLINGRPLTYISENPQELIPLTPAMFLIENRCSDTTYIDELNSRDLRKRMKYRIKLLSDLRQRFRKEYLSEIIELIPGRDGEIRTVRLKTQHGTVIRPFPLEVQSIANSDKELKEESISVKSTKPEKVLNTNDAIVKKYTSSGRLDNEPKRLDLLNYNL
ncbi:integrase catalytic domain-containing protein [Trichonephila clavipes]|nr:integrase catalytic domain-containing protein [Trichonephila clavipes]